jgi:hypothetical protein
MCLATLDLTATMTSSDSMTDHPCTSQAAIDAANPLTPSEEKSEYHLQTKITSAEDNARRRVRTAGMIPRKFRNQGDTGDSVFKPSYHQYLHSRVKSFDQNQYNYLREGNKTAVPGDNLSMSNVYASNSLNPYAKLLISESKGNHQFSYQWIDRTEYAVVLGDGYYDAADLQNAVNQALVSNRTYFVNNYTKENVYPISIFFDSLEKRMVIQCRNSSSFLDTAMFSKPSGAHWSLPYITGRIDLSAFNASSGVFLVPQLRVGPKFGAVIGLAAGNYPERSVESQKTGTAVVYSTDQVFYGAHPSIGPNFKPIYYKPNNPGFATQGAVTAGDRVTRLKYNTITKASSSFRTAYGSQTESANSYVYSIGNSAYGGSKTKHYKDIATPIFNPVNGQMECCQYYISKR